MASREHTPPLPQPKLDALLQRAALVAMAAVGATLLGVGLSLYAVTP